MDPQPAQSQDRFPSTSWTVVRLAAARHEPGAERALDEVFRSYERPVLAYILGHACAPHDAEDLKQAFFEHLLMKDALAAAVQAGVKLRAFLLTKLHSFLVDQYRRHLAQKRGGGRVANFSDLDETQVTLAEPIDSMTPLVAFQRQWVDTLAVNALATLRKDYARKGQVDLFDGIAPFITQTSDERLVELSLRLGRPEGTLKSDIFRLRSRCQVRIRAEVAATLDNPRPEDIEAELAELMGYRG